MCTAWEPGILIMTGISLTKRNIPAIVQTTNRFGAVRKNGPGKWGNADSTELGTDYASKLLHLAWHPEANVIAAAASNSLYMYCG